MCNPNSGHDLGQKQNSIGFSERLTIAELRTMTNKAHDDEFYERWLRRLSIYVTWVVLKTPLSANGVTYLNLLVGMVGVVCFSIDEYYTALIGVVCYFFTYVLDNVDGEVARARGTVSWKGEYLDWMAHVIPDCFLYVGIAMGYYQQNSQLWVLVFGFTSSLFYWITNNALWAYQRARSDENLQSGGQNSASVGRFSLRGYFSSPRQQKIVHDLRILVVLPILVVFNLQFILLPIYSLLYILSFILKTRYYLSLE